MSIDDVTSYERRPPRFADVSEDDWNDWHWQQRARLRRPADFEGVLELTEDEVAAFAATGGTFRTAVTPHYAALIDPDNPADPIRRQALPGMVETFREPFELADPLAEESHMPVPGLTHRYPDRVLLYATHNCPVYCRHCTRKRKVSDPRSATRADELESALRYIEGTPAVRDVLVSGGDPLSLSDERLNAIFRRLRSIRHVEVIRLGTRNPVTLPQRVNASFLSMLSAHAPIYMHTHFNHPAEFGRDAERALRGLLRAGCVLGNQMVLLRGVNDDAETVLSLNRKLLSAGCRPYYMLQCDMAEGITHFRTPLSTGLEILRNLRGRIGGMGIPDFVVDLPGGGGKIELVPERLVARRADGPHQVYTFENWAGERFEFTDVRDVSTTAREGFGLQSVDRDA